jgi:hypothetical protein
MHYCNVCNYTTKTLTSIKKHYTCQKHINNTNNVANVNNVNNVANVANVNQINQSNDLKNQLTNEIKKNYKYQFEIEKLKRELELTNLEVKNLESIIIKKNNQIDHLIKNNKNKTINNTNNKTITNNINIVVIKVKDHKDAMLLFDNIIRNHCNKNYNNQWLRTTILNQLYNSSYREN